MKSAEKERLIKSDILSIESRVRHAFNQGYDLGYKEGIKKNKKQPRTGYWIMKHRTHNEIKHYTGQDEMGETHTISVLERYEADEPYCSECGKRAGDTSQNYCCACGAKMVESQAESEIE